jgi:hypothetical protein
MKPADVEMLLGPPSALSKADVQTIVHDGTTEIGTVWTYQPLASTDHEESLVWNGGDGIIEVMFRNGEATGMTWVRLPGLVQRAKRQWHRWFPEK